MKKLLLALLALGLCSVSLEARKDKEDGSCDKSCKSCCWNWDWWKCGKCGSCEKKDKKEKKSCGRCGCKNMERKADNEAESNDGMERNESRENRRGVVRRTLRGASEPLRS